MLAYFYLLRKISLRKHHVHMFPLPSQVLFNNRWIFIKHGMNTVPLVAPLVLDFLIPTISNTNMAAIHLM
jgi:hypothetical protein